MVQISDGKRPQKCLSYLQLTPPDWPPRFFIADLSYTRFWLRPLSPAHCVLQGSAHFIFAAQIRITCSNEPFRGNHPIVNFSAAKRTVIAILHDCFNNPRSAVLFKPVQY
jgi:hypothetical protein